MEPMNLGSAPSSPSSPGVVPNYLPSFLMGESQPSTPNQVLSPERNRNYAVSSVGLPESGNLRQKLFTPIATEPSIISPNLDISVSKPGPPKRSLFDTIEPTSPNMSVFNNNRQHLMMESPSMHDLSRSAIYNQRVADTSGSYCKTDSFNSNANVITNDVHANLWVTVFGFPSNCASIVLSRFASCGTIVEKRFPVQGNWAHLKFSSPHETAKALALNGKLISSCVMVGVIPHQNKQANKENADVSLYTSPIRARPLRHTLASPQGSNTVVTPQNVPQKSTGLVTKAMEYVFGW